MCGSMNGPKRTRRSAGMNDPESEGEKVSRHVILILDDANRGDLSRFIWAIHVGASLAKKRAHLEQV